MATIETKNINIGGIADSAYLGGENSVYEMVGLNIHETPGLIKVNQKLTSEGGELIDDLIKTAVSCSDGNVYEFGSTNGKVWKRDAGGLYSLVATVAPPSGLNGITGSMEIDGYIYYAMETRLGRWQIGTSWASRDDDFATFQNGNNEFHPMKVLNLVLYIGDGNLIAQVDAGVFSANALDLPEGYIIKCLGQLGTDLLMGTFINHNVIGTQIFRWNTWSVSFTNSDPIPEIGINSFLATDNFVIVNAGKKGNLYMYDGVNLDLYKQIRGEWGVTKKATVFPEASLNFNGLPLFALSTESGDPTVMGIYSLGRANRNYSYVLNCEHISSTNLKAGIVFGTIIGVGDIFLVTWKAGTQYGVDRLDINNKFDGAYLKTRAMMPDRMKLTTFSEVFAGYKTLPAGCDIEFHKSVNYDPYVLIDDPVSITDDQRKVKYSAVDINDASVLQMMIVLRTSANLAPEVDLIHTRIKD